MDSNEFQAFCKTTAVFPKEMAIPYLTLGLVGEAGEVAEKVKKIIRDKSGKFSMVDEMAIATELSDVLWYLAMLGDELGFTLTELYDINYEKLKSRQERGKLHGSGDNR